jgi:hypothetical protein
MAERARVDVLLIGNAETRDDLTFIVEFLVRSGVRPELLAEPGASAAPNLIEQIAGASAVAIAHGPGSPSGAAQVAETAGPGPDGSKPLFRIILPGADPTARQLALERSDPQLIVDLEHNLHDERRLKRFAETLQALRARAEEPDASSATRKGPPSTAQRPGPKPPDELAAIWRRITPFARDAFNDAEGMRRAAGSDMIHMEHLLAGLYANEPGALRSVVAAAGLTEPTFRHLLLAVARTPFPGPGDFDPVALRRVPPVSGHVREALVHASQVAGPGDVRRRHLVFGALSVADCDPVERLLKAGVNRENALTWDVPLPLTTKASAQTDQPTAIDLLGYTSLVDALTELLTGPDTTFPLTIAISAPWGGGKSSVMRQLQRRLRTDATVEAQRQPTSLRSRISLATKGLLPTFGRLWRAVVDWLNVLIRRRPRTTKEATADGWVIVDFPAWRYDTGEQLWAAMAKQTYDKGRESRRGWLAKLRFRWEIERPRFSPWPVLARVAIAGAGGAAGVVAGLIVSGLAGAPADDSATAATVGGVGGTVAVARAFWSSASDPFKRAVESITAQPGIAAGDGFTPEAEQQVRALFRLLLKGEGRVAIFIDDLDRCTPKNLVRVIEVVNQIFVASADAAGEAEPTGSPDGEPERTARRLAFIFGMDRYVVARGIEAEYDVLLGVLAKYRDAAGEDFGLSFLDKIIQLWVTLPTPSPAGLEFLLRTAAGFDDESRGGVDVGRANQEMLSAVKDIPPTDRPAIVAATQAVIDSTEDDRKFAAELARQAILSSSAPRSPVDSPEVWTAMKLGADCLEPNPRQRKRYNNAFRLQLNLASRSSGVTFSPDELNALARWVAIRLRWGRLAQAMDENPALLRALERTANGRRQIVDIDAMTAAEQRRRTPEWFDESSFADLPDLLKVLRVQAPKQAISKLPFNAFVRVA